MSKTLAQMQEEVYEWAESKGWNDKPRSFGDECSLLHSEISEALEAYRKWGFEDPTLREMVINPKPEGVASEFADLLIRLLHYAEAHDIDLEEEYERKMAYNKTRGYRHGGKLL